MHRVIPILVLRLSIGLVSDNVDLILANATASLQAAAAGTTDIPILGTAVTEYGVALEIDDFDGTVGGNISGTSDLAPLDQQAAMLNELFPDAKNCRTAVLFCRGKLPVSGRYSTSSPGRSWLYLLSSMHSLIPTTLLLLLHTAASDSDVIYVPTDNTVASNTEIINNICSAEKVPVIAGEEGICQGCGVATLSISYYDLGVATGKMAVQYSERTRQTFLTMPIEYAPKFTKEYNPDRLAEAYGH